jgi:hypothetical protein
MCTVTWCTLKRGSKIGLMMILWVETCRHTYNWQQSGCVLTVLYLEYQKKRSQASNKMYFGWSPCSPITFNKQNSSVWVIQNAHTQAIFASLISTCSVKGSNIRSENFQPWQHLQNAIDWSMSHNRITATRKARIIFCCLLVRTAAECAPEMGNPLIRG